MAFSGCPMGGGLFGIGFGWLFQLLIFVTFFLVVWWLLKSNPAIGKISHWSNETALDILKKRLAAGEIDKKEFEDLKKEIE